MEFFALIMSFFVKPVPPKMAEPAPVVIVETTKAEEKKEQSKKDFVIDTRDIKLDKKSDVKEKVWTKDDFREDVQKERAKNTIPPDWSKVDFLGEN
jgi:hypothetical protein